MLNDTIIAIATAPGTAGVGIIRLSGPRAVEAVAPWFHASDHKPLKQQTARLMAHGTLVDIHGVMLDEALVVRFEAPHSFTGEDVVEIHAHGGTYHLQQLQSLILEGAKSFDAPLRSARAGEFTQRAFLNGKMDLTRAEAVADLIHSGSELSREAAARQLAGGLQQLIEGLRQGVLGLLAEAEASCDFPDDESQLATREQWALRSDDLIAAMQRLLDDARTGRMVTQGVRVALAGAPNAGKSSLLNALCGEDRAIVSPEAGTTRDYLEQRYQIEGFPIVLFDTAGLREAKGAIEAEGVRRAQRIAADADILLLILDQSAPFDADVLAIAGAGAAETLFVLNKNDLAPVWDITALRTALKSLRPEWAEAEHLRERVISISAKRGDGLRALQTRILDRALSGRAAQILERVVLTQVRHERALRDAFTAMQRVREGLKYSAAPELLAVDLHQALNALGEIVGATARAEVIEEIFRRFCIGK